MHQCPIGVNIPGFIRQLREGNVKEAYEKIRETNPFPSICGRICSAPCEAACVLTEEGAPIGIRALERYSADFGSSKTKRSMLSSKGKKVAIVGSGPSGLAAAYALTLKGHSISVFEALDKPGGVLRYGIPEFRLPKKILDEEIAVIKNLGVEIQTNFFIGETASLIDLFAQGFSAILLATGAGIPKFIDLPGTHWGGVYFGEEFLMRVNLTRPGIFSRHKQDFVLGSKVAVIGSGNTALDCARAAVRFGSQTTVVFRRTEEEMYVRRDEREFGKEEGIIFEPLVKPLEIIADSNNFVAGLKCVRMDYADNSESGKWDLIPVPNSEFVLEADTVIIAIGHKPNSFVSKFDSNLVLDADGTIQVDEATNLTSVSGIFACGNVVTNAGPVVEAIAAGKKAAENISHYLK